MPVLPSPLNRARHRTRRGLKRCAYSGFARDRWQRPGEVLVQLSLDEGQRVADIGAGGGYFTFRLARAVGATGTVYAVDTDADMTALVAEQAAREGWGNVVPIHAEPDDPALPGPVDLALLVNTFHHLPDPRSYAAKLLRHVREGGRVAVVEPHPRWFLFGHAAAPAEIRATMGDAGLLLDDEHTFLPRQSFLVFRGAGRRP